MTKNQNILLGCGGAGCLGTILVAIIFFGFLGYTWSQIADKAPRRSPPHTSGSPPAPVSVGATTAAAMADEEKHRLFHAVGVTKDETLIRVVTGRLGLLNPDGTPTAAFEPFMKGHLAWALKDAVFVQEVKTPDKAREYVNRQMPSVATPSTLAAPQSPGGVAPVSGGSLNGKALSLPQPAYPAAARAVRAQGAVVVQVTVDETGKVASAHAGGSGHPLLKQAAEQAAYQARFPPARASGQITYNFTLGSAP